MKRNIMKEAKYLTEEDTMISTVDISSSLYGVDNKHQYVMKAVNKLLSIDGLFEKYDREDGSLYVDTLNRSAYIRKGTFKTKAGNKYPMYEINLHAYSLVLGFLPNGVGVYEQLSLIEYFSEFQKKDKTEDCFKGS